MDLGILVLSCDKYSHVWPAFFKCFTKYFPDCRFPVYLGSNTVDFKWPGVKTLLTGDDPDWSTSLARILAQIPERRLFIILEDLLLASPMDSEAFSAAARFMSRENAKHLKYYRPDPCDREVPGEPYGIYDRGRPYRISVVGFWDKEYLLSILIPGENPWNFEILGSYRTSYQDGFFMMEKPLCQFANLIEKGRWYPSAVRWAASENLDIGLEKRLTLSGVHQLKSLAQILFYKVMNKIPWRLRVRFMGFMRKIMISY